MKYWIPEHIKQFLDTLNEDINSSNNIKSFDAYLIKMLVLLSFNLGERIGETRAICYSNISKEYNTIDIKYLINYNTKDSNLFCSTKTFSSQRKLDVSDKLIEEIDNYKLFIETKLGININPDLPIIFNYSTNKPYSNTTLRKNLIII